MTAEGQISERLPFNPEVLRWAREWRGRSLEEAAQKVNVETKKLAEWERGDAVPTVRQGRILAGFYERSFLEFFLSRIPKVIGTKLVPDFRLHRDVSRPRDERELQAIQDWAYEIRQNAIELFEMLGDNTPTLPGEFEAALDSNPERISAEIRTMMNYSIEEQMSLSASARGQAAKALRRAIESLGIIVLKDSRLGKFGVRGITLFSNPLPVIVFGVEAPTAQTFTLAHELGHIVLKQSAISGPPSARESKNFVERSERWCDEFAGSLLIPASALAQIWSRPNRPHLEIGDAKLSELANEFAVSRHAMIIRLVQLQYVAPEYYWNVKRPLLIAQEADFKGGGKAAYYGTRYRNAHGDLYTSLVLEAWGSGQITNHSAAELMGIKNLQHLFDIRDNFSS